VGWWITGLVIYFNKYNNCYFVPATLDMNNLVLVVLIYQSTCVILLAIAIPLIALLAICKGFKALFGFD